MHFEMLSSNASILHREKAEDGEFKGHPELHSILRQPVVCDAFSQKVRREQKKEVISKPDPWACDS